MEHDFDRSMVFMAAALGWRINPDLAPVDLAVIAVFWYMSFCMGLG